jgi:hypothetical protein
MILRMQNPAWAKAQLIMEALYAALKRRSSTGDLSHEFSAAAQST